jgi:hypothetical protein
MILNDQHDRVLMIFAERGSEGKIKEVRVGCKPSSYGYSV